MSHTLLCQYTKLISSSFAQYIPPPKKQKKNWKHTRMLNGHGEWKRRGSVGVIKLQLMIYHSTIDALTERFMMRGGNILFECRQWQPGSSSHNISAPCQVWTAPQVKRCFDSKGEGRGEWGLSAFVLQKKGACS